MTAESSKADRCIVSNCNYYYYYNYYKVNLFEFSTDFGSPRPAFRDLYDDGATDQRSFIIIPLTSIIEIFFESSIAVL